MKAQERRTLGDAATGAAQVNLGGEAPEERLLVSFGDVVALSGDYFVADGFAVLASPGDAWHAEALASDGLFGLSLTPGDRGQRPGSRDEVICALKVMAEDQGMADARFEPGGEFEDFAFSPAAADTEVERRVRDRFPARDRPPHSLRLRRRGLPSPSRTRRR